MKRALFLLALAACGDDKPQRELPGTIWFVEDGAAPTLVRFAGGTRTPIAPNVFPSPSVLPDGRLVAIASRGDGSAESEQLVLVAANGKLERFGPPASQVRDPAVDARGRWIVAAINFDGHSELYRVQLTGEITRLTNDPQGNFSPTLIGESIVYVSSRDGDAELYRDTQRLTAFHRDDWQPTPAPDGKTIVFLSDRDGIPHLYLMNADGTQLRRLTMHSGEESAPTWSVDGKQLAYVVDGHVWVHDTTTGSDRQVTPSGASDLEPSFSPDGRWLAVSRVRGDSSDLVVVSLESGELVPIATNARLPRWR